MKSSGGTSSIRILLVIAICGLGLLAYLGSSRDGNQVERDPVGAANKLDRPVRKDQNPLRAEQQPVEGQRKDVADPIAAKYNPTSDPFIADLLYGVLLVEADNSRIKVRGVTSLLTSGFVNPHGFKASVVDHAALNERIAPIQAEIRECKGMVRSSYGMALRDAIAIGNFRKLEVFGRDPLLSAEEQGEIGRKRYQTLLRDLKLQHGIKKEDFVGSDISVRDSAALVFTTRAGNPEFYELRDQLHGLQLTRSRQLKAAVQALRRK